MVIKVCQYFIMIAYVAVCILYVNMGFMEVMNDIEVPICRKKNRQNAP